MNRGAPRTAGPPPYRSRQYERPAYRNRSPAERYRPPPPRRAAGMSPPPRKPKSSKYTTARNSAKRIPSIIGVVASIIPLVDWIMDKIGTELAQRELSEGVTDQVVAPKHYDFAVNDRVMFREDSDDPDIERSSVPVYRVCKLGSAANTFNLWDPLEKRVVAQDIDGHCLEKARKR
ncbi:hypothetical protein B0J12DRAFT_704088 [Macrophomina phaseolina]|uniref:Uncharacterized protein n=1 Tax=Macrophomina phaseolina TaxID=35725 RepID=A0ABQ8FWE6_9PEZI|nr:hypothetical protein B0J12DRAFT_704088 [Macrophomina phaseolina]